MTTEQAYRNGYCKGLADANAKRAQGHWKYYYKKGIAVCTNCSFERDVNMNFGHAVACPNCGAVIVGAELV